MRLSKPASGYLPAGKGWRGVFLLLIPLFVFAVSAATMEENIKVSLVLYSGKKDPAWEITQADKIATIKRSLKDLPPVAQPEWPGLGWRGYMLTGMSGAPLPGIVRVFKGVICVTQGDQKHCYRDTHKLEDWLRSEAVEQGLGHFLSARQ